MRFKNSCYKYCYSPVRYYIPNQICATLFCGSVILKMTFAFLCSCVMLLFYVLARLKRKKIVYFKPYQCTARRVAHIGKDRFTLEPILKTTNSSPVSMVILKAKFWGAFFQLHYHVISYIMTFTLPLYSKFHELSR